jgi:hypothetical protein
MTIDERREFVEVIFAQIRAKTPRPTKVQACRANRGSAGQSRGDLWYRPERKTGLYVPNVETGWLVRDERGWLRLAS